MVIQYIRKVAQMAAKKRAVSSTTAAIAEAQITPTKSGDGTWAPQEEQCGGPSNHTLRNFWRRDLSAAVPVQKRLRRQGRERRLFELGCHYCVPKETPLPGKLVTGGARVLMRRKAVQSPGRQTIRNQPRLALSKGANYARAGLVVWRQGTQVIPVASIRAHISP